MLPRQGADVNGTALAVAVRSRAHERTWVAFELDADQPSLLAGPLDVVKAVAMERFGGTEWRAARTADGEFFWGLYE